MLKSDNLNILPLPEWSIFNLSRPGLIAGPCSAETESQMVETAERMSGMGVSVFRAGIWKPRTHPGCFEGVGSKGLEWLMEVKRRTGMAVATEVANAKHVKECLTAGVDMLWIGARTTANPFLVQEIADALEGADVYVMVKNPVSPDMDLWIGALERLNNAGVRKLGVVHRGFSSSEKMKYRNDPLWQYAVELRSLYPSMPFFCDPSHIAGQREYVSEISQRAMDLGLDGLMIECHCNPDSALSDAGQQLTPEEFGNLIHTYLILRERDSKDAAYKETLGQLRAQIDVVDENIVNLLAQRMEISRKIGEGKKKNNVAILQTSRWCEVLSEMIRKGKEKGLDEGFIRTVFNAIHDASIKAQE